MWKPIFKCSLEFQRVCKKLVPFHQKNIPKTQDVFLPLWKIQSFFDLFFGSAYPIRSHNFPAGSSWTGPTVQEGLGGLCSLGSPWHEVIFSSKKNYGGKSADQRIFFKTFQKKWWVKLPESKSRIKSKLLDPRRVAELFWPCWVGRQMRNCWDHPFKRIKPQLIGEPPKWLPKFQVINKV